MRLFGFQILLLLLLLLVVLFLLAPSVVRCDYYELPLDAFVDVKLSPSNPAFLKFTLTESEANSSSSVRWSSLVNSNLLEMYLKFGPGASKDNFERRTIADARSGSICLGGRPQRIGEYSAAIYQTSGTGSSEITARAERNDSSCILPLLELLVKIVVALIILGFACCGCIILLLVMVLIAICGCGCCGLTATFMKRSRAQYVPIPEAERPRMISEN